jgi:hypothetical protein
LQQPVKYPQEVPTSATDVESTRDSIGVFLALVAPAIPITVGPIAVAIITIWPIAIAVIRVGWVCIAIIRVGWVAIAIITTAIGSAILSSPVGNLLSGRIGFR